MSRNCDRFRDALSTQLTFIQNSCELYDAGCECEGLRIATCISTTLLDTPKQKSIITHLLKDHVKTIKLWTTNTSNMQGVHFFDLLGKFDDDGKQVPFLDESAPEYTQPGMLSIAEWFDQGVIGLTSVTPKQSYFIDRKLIVRTARDKDGGAHLDSDIKNPAYILLKDGIEVMESDQGNIITTAQLHLVALRQIGHEVLKSNLLEQVLMLEGIKK